MKKIIIVSPHPDDELIGCYEIIKKYINAEIIIIYTSNEINKIRREECLKLKEKFENIRGQMFLNTIPSPLISKEISYFLTDPINEYNPEHMRIGNIGEQMFRDGFDITFYSTQMNVPYIHEVSNPECKRDLLDEIYSSQSSLWKYEHKYFLYEGRYKWIL